MSFPKICNCAYRAKPIGQSIDGYDIVCTKFTHTNDCHTPTFSFSLLMVGENVIHPHCRAKRMV